MVVQLQSLIIELWRQRLCRCQLSVLNRSVHSVLENWISTSLFGIILLSISNLFLILILIYQSVSNTELVLCSLTKPKPVYSQTVTSLNQMDDIRKVFSTKIIGDTFHQIIYFGFFFFCQWTVPRVDSPTICIS